MELKICSYNCCSLKKNIDLIRELTEDSYEIIFLQETFILDDRLGDLAVIDERYESVGIPATYSEKALVTNDGRAEGCLACLWRKDSPFIINKIITEDKFIAILISVGNNSILLVNVYIYFMGDFNADPVTGSAWNNLFDFVLRNSLMFKCWKLPLLLSFLIIIPIVCK